MIRFVKGHGTENDFVLLPDADGELDLTADLVRRLCDRRAGLGADGVLRVVRTEADPHAIVPALRRAAAELDPSMPLSGVRTMDEHVASALSKPRFFSSLITSFGALAVTGHRAPGFHPTPAAPRRYWWDEAARRRRMPLRLHHRAARNPAR